MSTSQITYVIGAMILIFMFGGLMALVFADVSSFLEGKSGDVVVNNREEVGQLIAYSATRAYVCDESGGGHRSNSLTSNELLWEDYESYKTRGVFNDLEDATPMDIQCSGTATHLPLTTKGFWDTAANTVAKSDQWGNDQEGRFSRIEFKVNSSLNFPIRFSYGCVAQQSAVEDQFDMTYMFGDGDSYSYMIWDSSGFSAHNCHNLNKGVGPGGDTITTSGGALMNVNVFPQGIPADKVFYNGHSNSDATGWVEIKDSNTPIDGFFSSPIDVRHYPIRLCPGAQGYVQTNTGGPDQQAVHKNDKSSPGYDASNPPGFSDKEQAGHEMDDNTIHPYLVISHGGDCP